MPSSARPCACWRAPDSGAPARAQPQHEQQHDQRQGEPVVRAVEGALPVRPTPTEQVHGGQQQQHVHHRRHAVAQEEAAPGHAQRAGQKEQRAALAHQETRDEGSRHGMAPREILHGRQVLRRHQTRGPRTAHPARAIVVAGPEGQRVTRQQAERGDDHEEHGVQGAHQRLLGSRDQQHVLRDRRTDAAQEQQREEPAVGGQALLRGEEGDGEVEEQGLIVAGGSFATATDLRRSSSAPSRWPVCVLTQPALWPTELRERAYQRVAE